MYRYKRLLVGLSLGKQDGSSIRYAAMISKLARSEKITFLHVASTPDIPEELRKEFTEILVPVDFSENSMDAMEVAVALALAAGLKEIHCLHVYSVPLGYYKTGKSHEEFAEIMKGHAEKNLQEFMKKVDLKGLTATPIYKLEKREHKGIEEVIEEHEIYLLVIGARGRRAGAGVMLGSVTEHLIRTTTIPLLAVKRKGTGMGLLEALLKL